MKPKHKRRHPITNSLRGCPRAPRAIMVDGKPLTATPCPEAGCWGVKGHQGLHSDGKARWTAKGRPVLGDGSTGSAA